LGAVAIKGASAIAVARAKRWARAVPRFASDFTTKNEKSLLYLLHGSQWLATFGLIDDTRFAEGAVASLEPPPENV
jgi:hypothetical protein